MSSLGIYRKDYVSWGLRFLAGSANSLEISCQWLHVSDKDNDSLSSAGSVMRTQTATQQTMRSAVNEHLN